MKNASNSVINAMQVADCLIRAGIHRRILIASGEAPTAAVRWQRRDCDQFIRAFPGCVMSDGDSAVILEANETADREIQASTFRAVLGHWQVGTLPSGGTIRGHDPESTYFKMDCATSVNPPSSSA